MGNTIQTIRRDITTPKESLSQHRVTFAAEVYTFRVQFSPYGKLPKAV